MEMFKRIEEISKANSDLAAIIAELKAQTGMTKREATEWVKAWVMSA
jgi:uncharacterized protein YdhG (YjbR/CyaY superfamily)